MSSTQVKPFAAPRPTRAVLRRLWRHAGKGHPGLLWAAFGAMAVLGLTTGALTYLAGPALQFLLTGGAEGMELWSALEPWVGDVDRDRALWALPALIVAVAALKGVAYLAQFYWIGLYGQRVVMDLRREVFTKLCRLPTSEVARRGSGDLLSRMTSDLGAIELAANYTVGAYVRDGIQLVVLAGVVIAVNWKLALGSLLLIPAAALPVARLTRGVLRRTREAQKELGRLASQVQEGLGGVRTIQAFNGQPAELLRLEHHARVQREAVTRAGWLRGAVPSLMEVCAAGAVASVLAFAAWSRVIRPDDLIQFLTALVLVYQPAKEIGRVSQFAVQAAAAGERLFELLDIPETVPDRPGAAPAPVPRRQLRLRDVSFSYGDRPALSGLNLELPIGKVIALVGPSGGGKSTVATLLMRFRRPSTGRLELDGEDVERFTASSVRRHLALVTQEPLLFSTTILENIRFGRPDATEEEVVAAARVANAHGFIEALPEGYRTAVGERGVVLSGGQKQRVCVARAVLSQAAVLVLDEATSNLDPQSEREVQAALSRLLVGRTALVIAHRLATVVTADLIHVVEAGRVVESGSHAELLERGGAYARLWALQSGAATEAA